MEKERDTAESRPVPGLTLELQHAAAVFDAAPLSGGRPDGHGGGPAAGRGDVLRAKAHHLRKMAALCSMAARRLVELEAQAGTDAMPAQVAAEVRAIEQFLVRQFRGETGDSRGTYLADSSGPAGGRGPGDRAEG